MEIKHGSVFFDGKMYQSVDGFINTDNPRLIEILTGKKPAEEKKVEAIKEESIKIEITESVVEKPIDEVKTKKAKSK